MHELRVATNAISIGRSQHNVAGQPGCMWKQIELTISTACTWMIKANRVSECYCSSGRTMRSPARQPSSDSIVVSVTSPAFGSTDKRTKFASAGAPLMVASPSTRRPWPYCPGSTFRSIVRSAKTISTTALLEIGFDGRPISSLPPARTCSVPTFKRLFASVGKRRKPLDQTSLRVVWFLLPIRRLHQGGRS